MIGSGAQRIGSEAPNLCYNPCCRDRGTDAEAGRPFVIPRKAPARALLNGGAAVARYKESNPFYHSDEWKKVRAAALERDAGMCCDCMDKFRAGYGRKPRRATMVHHLQSIEERPDLALDLANLRSLCDACHNKKHPEKGRRQAEPKRTRMRVIKV